MNVSPEAFRRIPGRAPFARGGSSLLRTSGVRLIACAVVLAAALAFGTGSAAAAIGAKTFFGGRGTEGGKFSYPIGGLAINQTGAGGVAAGDVYVADTGNSRVQVFSADGAFLWAFGADVGGPGVDVCSVASSCVAGASSGGAAGAIPAPHDIAVDQMTGAVYVVSEDVGGVAGPKGNNRIDVFSASGEFEGAFGWNVNASAPAQALQFCTEASGCQKGSAGSGAGQITNSGYSGNGRLGIAVSPLNGHLLLADGPNRRIDEFAPTFTGSSVTGVAFVRGYGWGVATGASEFQICTSSCHAPSSQMPPDPPGGFGPESPNDVTVGPDGSVYASDRIVETPQLYRVEKFDPNGQFSEDFISNNDGTLNGITRLFFNQGLNQLVLVQYGSADGGFGTQVGVYDAAGEVVATYSLFGPENAGVKEMYGIEQEEPEGTIFLTTGFSSKEGPEVGLLAMGEAVPPVATIEPVSVFGGTTATFEGVVNPTGLFTDYAFEYSDDGGATWTKAGEGSLNADESDHPVSAEASGLEALTSYRVRLVATKVLGAGSATAETSFETSSAAPVVGAPKADQISDRSARLTGSINPERQDTTYRFECVTQSEFEASGYAGALEVPVGGANLEAAGESIPVSQPLSGLAEATRYRCRLTAANPTGSDTGPETTFTTYRGVPSIVADGRAYEQATPVQKNGGDASGWQYLEKASPDGEAISYFITSGGSVGRGGQEFPTYTATRSSTGWSSHPLLPSSSAGTRVVVLGWSQDLASDYVLVWNTGSKATLYVQDVASGALEKVAAGLEPFEGADFAGESSDGSLLLFESSSALLPKAKAGVPNLYQWNRSTHSLTLVSLLPGDLPPTTGSFAGPYDWPNQNVKTGGAEAEMYLDLRPMSEDGKTVFFTTRNIAHLYARTGIGTPGATTVQVDASQKTNGSGPNGTDPEGAKKAAFMLATPSGSHVFFTSPSELTNDATTGSEDQGNDLYRYDVSSGDLIDIAPDSTDAHGAEVQGVLGASDDGSYVYFAANGVLGAGAAPGGCESSPTTGWGLGSTCNLYVWHEGEITFISRIGPGVTSGGLNWIPSVGAINLVAMNPARVSEDGKTLLFATDISPTAYDSEGNYEFYRYEVGAGLSCVSCNPTGAAPVGSATLQNIEPGLTKPSIPAPSFVRNMSSDGKRIFFETPDKLLAADTNGDSGCPQGGLGVPALRCQDVYEWEANGTGSCESSAENGGCLYLVSTGKSSEPSYFADASADGGNAFFFTRQSLVGQDTDQLQDIYDARVSGGISTQNPPPPNPCSGEACRGDVGSPPAAQSPGSAGFVGPGNSKPHPSCRHGFKRKHGKCVTKKHRKRHHRHHAKHRNNKKTGGHR